MLSDAGLTPILTNFLDDLEHILSEEEPHLLLVDLILPGTTSFEAPRNLPDIGFTRHLFLSERGGDEQLPHLLGNGPSVHNVKPYTPCELGAGIKAFLVQTDNYP